MTPDLPSTEQVNPRSAELDLLPTQALVELLVSEQRGAVDAVFERATVLSAVAQRVAERLERGGRLHYVGAGTSGRIGVLDAAEIPPTFGADPRSVCAHVAGGAAALVRAIEGAEDDGDAGDAEMRAHVKAGDAVVGISASGSAAYVVRAVERAKRIGAFTVALVNAEHSPLAATAETAIVLATGPEALTGSTRLAAGTAQKIALNVLSTAIMVKLGKVYGNLMVDVVATNRKLRNRALRLVRMLTDADDEGARDLLERAGGNVKVAVVMRWRGIGPREAANLLGGCGGSLRALAPRNR
ncbi:MAG: N-acetylmuramic acid 6-phosphate etherase [Candidatus Eremiobacteraeota bacterium]|nr:N-acetylmuramic acid 6-phosphate etherase [Candidatus Eremiobacteraeota bacterium]